MTINPYRLDPDIRATYLRLVASIEALKQMPLEYRAEYWWQEQFAQFQKLRDLLVPPRPPKRNRTNASTRQHSAYFNDPQWVNQRMKMFGDKPLSSHADYRFLVNWK